MKLSIHNPKTIEYENVKLFDESVGHFNVTRLNFDDDEISIFADKEYVFMSKDRLANMLQDIAEDTLHTRNGKELKELINEYIKEI